MRFTHLTLPYPVFPSTSAMISAEARLSSTKDHLAHRKRKCSKSERVKHLKTFNWIVQKIAIAHPNSSASEMY
jgi:hypothetical protein